MSQSAAQAVAPRPTDLGTLDCTLDAGIAHRAAIGLLVLATDQTMEHEFRHLLHLDGVAVYHSRLHNDAQITPETLRAMRPLIAPATALLLPGLKLDVVGFGCTSASIVLGEEVVFGEIRKSRPGIACTTPATAALAAFRALGARRIAVLTPYLPEVNAAVANWLTSRGMDVAALATFNKPDDRDAARVSVASIAQGVRTLVRGAKPDAVFVACTSLRLAEAIADIEADAGVPVTSSDHALAWHCLRLAGVGDPTGEGGRLFQV